MLSLTPLHFSTKNIDGERVISYGSSFYFTDCGRFILNLEGGRWFIWSAISHWHSWVDDVGLRKIPFETRREALQTLAQVLTAEDLMDAPFPT